MNTGRYSSIERLLEEITNENDLEKAGITVSTIVEWVGYALDLMGVKLNYEQVPPEKVIIDHYRGELPCDWIKIIQVREYSSKTPMQYTTDNFHIKGKCHVDSSQDLRQINSKYTYEINGNYIYTNFESGDIEFSYIRIATDDNGLPLIPEDTKTFLAVAAYIQMRIDRKLSKLNQLDFGFYRESKSEWAFRAGQVKTFKLTPKNVDEWESLKNQFVRLMPNTQAWKNSFKYSNNQEMRPNNPR